MGRDINDVSHGFQLDLQFRSQSHPLSLSSHSALLPGTGLYLYINCKREDKTLVSSRCTGVDPLFTTLAVGLDLTVGDQD